MAASLTRIISYIYRCMHCAVPKGKVRDMALVASQIKVRWQGLYDTVVRRTQQCSIPSTVSFDLLTQHETNLWLEPLLEKLPERGCVQGCLSGGTAGVLP